MTIHAISTSCAVLLVVALSTEALAQSPVPSAALSDNVPMRMQDARLAHTATALPDGTVLVVGGFSSPGTIGRAEVFDPISRTFHDVGDLRQPRFAHRATALPDGRVLITGGDGTLGPPLGLSSVEVYDPENESFSRIGKLKTNRFGHTATLLDDGRVLVTGGYGKGVGKPVASAELFDPATGTSTSIGKMHDARAGHTATLLEDGRVAIIGGVREDGHPARTLEVYDPRRQRFSRALKLPALPDLQAVLRLADGRVFLTAAQGGPIIVAPDAGSSERLSAPPTVHGQLTATLLADGRVVLIGALDGGPARVDVFDPTSDTFEAADPMRQTRQGHTAVRLDDGTVLVVGGLLSGNGCYQALATAEIWDPVVMASVAGDAEVQCTPWEARPQEPPPALGATAPGGRIEMPGSAFAITLPDDWSVELADPDTDVFTADPGSAWEALRAIAPDGRAACSVVVGVADVSLRNRSGTASSDASTPSWDPNRRRILRVPTPRTEAGDASYGFMAPRERLHRRHPGLKHDALYSIHCAGDSDRGFESIAESLDFLPRGE